jgi:hypothetical protein
MKYINFHHQSGQVLTTLIIIMFFGLTIATAATALIDSSSLATTDLVESNQALIVAESGVEDALIKLLRNPSFVGGTLPVGTDTATIIIGTTNPTIITSRGQAGHHLRTIEVGIGYSGGIMSVNYWQEK